MIGAGLVRNFAAQISAVQAAVLAQLAAIGGSSLVGFIQSGAGAVARTLQGKARDFVNVMDFGAVGDGVTDDTAAINAAATAAFGANKTLWFPGLPFKITAPLDWTGYANVTVRGEGFGATPTQPIGTRIIQATDNVPIVRLTARPDMESIALLYANQQLVGSTGAIGLELNKLSGGAIQRVRVWQANTSAGIPQVGFGDASNFVFNTVIDIESWSASRSHLDLRNFNGGGTNVKIPKLYINGGGSADFSTPGQSAAYAIQGAQWSGYELGAISIDGLAFTTRLVDLFNCHFHIGTIRYEACTCKADNDGWFVLGGGDTTGIVELLNVKNTRALLADVPTGTHLFRLNAAHEHFEVRALRVEADCNFTAPLVRPLTLTGGSDASSVIKFGPINAAAAGFTSTTWSDATGLTPYAVKVWNAQSVEETWKFGRNTGIYRRRYDAAAPVAGTWAVGDIVWNTAPAAGGNLGWICTTAGTPGTWQRFGFARLENSKVFDPATVAAGAEVTTVLGMAGAALGDYANVSFSLDLQGLTMTSYVSSAGNVTVRFRNPTAAGITPGAGTIHGRVEKQ